MINEKLKGLDWHDLYDAGSLVNPKFFLHRETVLEIRQVHIPPKEAPSEKPLQQLELLAQSPKRLAEVTKYNKMYF